MLTRGSVKNVGESKTDSETESKNDGALDFFFRIPETGVLSNLRAGRAPILRATPPGRLGLKLQIESGSSRFRAVPVSQ
jgi:hypothetical protein